MERQRRVCHDHRARQAHQTLDGLIHYILEHGAHHVNMGIPLYRLKEAQARLTATLDERLNSEVFHLALLLEYRAALQAVRFRAPCVDGF